jgi:flagellar motor switch protein FliN/FliY
MGDFLPELEVESAPPVRDPAMLWWNQPLDVAAGASIWVGTAEETWTDLGRRILAAAGVEEFSPAELKDTYLEVLRQSLGVLATAVGGKLGREVTTTTGSEEAPSSEPVFGCHVSIRVSGQKLPSLVFYISHEMLDAFENAASPAVESEQAVEAGSADPDNPTHLSDRACGTLDLLLDVEMPVSVSFGRTQVRVQEILKLITGSIIELDRGIAEPVEVIVNNCTIARGEVVVVDGNYGVRIQEVMSRGDRLRESRKYLLPASTRRH